MSQRTHYKQWAMLSGGGKPPPPLPEWLSSYYQTVLHAVAAGRLTPDEAQVLIDRYKEGINDHRAELAREMIEIYSLEYERAVSG